MMSTVVVFVFLGLNWYDLERILLLDLYGKSSDDVLYFSNVLLILIIEEDLILVFEHGKPLRLLNSFFCNIL